MKVGSVAQVKSFSDYIIKVPIESDEGYIPVSKIPLGSYVIIESCEGGVVGIVTDVLHSIKEDYLPYLSEEKQEVFLPYATDFRSSYLKVKGIGNMQNGVPCQELIFAPRINDTVKLMEARDIRAFHIINGGKAGFTYYKRLSETIDPVVFCEAIGRVADSMPECGPILRALKKYTENKA